MSERSLDVVLYGATGFAGRQAVRYLRAAAPEGLRWGIAGRNPDKLAGVAEEFELGDEVARVVADSRDPAAVRAMVAQARVVATTAGPFAKYGDPVVAACVEEGTDYVDITGETPWVRSLIDRFHEAAAAREVRIVPCCGFDSIPSDLGAWMMVRWIRETWDLPTRRVQSAFAAGRAGFNGGTLASVFHMAESGQLDALQDPLLLNPVAQQSDAERARNPDRSGTSWEPDLECFLAPFIMAPINTRVVRRSQALLAGGPQAYGAEFQYAEALELKTRMQAWGVSSGMRVAEGVLRTGFLRGLARRFAPRPGEGPSEEGMAKGWFRCRFLAEAADGRQAVGIVAGEGDPANRATVRMLCEAALCLAREREALPTHAGAGGILTPATALGEVLLRRLRAAGMRLQAASQAQGLAASGVAPYGA